MLKRGLSFFLMLAMCLILTSCTTCKIQPTAEVFSPVEMHKGRYMNKVDNFVVVLDASQSMEEKFNGYNKMDLAHETVKRFNMTIPSDMRLNSSLRTFGHGDCMSSQETTLKLYGFQRHMQAGFSEALSNVVCAGGNSPLSDALMAVNEDLNSLVGRSAVIIVSDGKDMGKSAIGAAEQIAESHSDVCVYSVLVGNDKAGKNLLHELSQVTYCGYMIDYSKIYSPDAMAEFVKDVFYGREYVPEPKPVPEPEPEPVIEPSPMDSDGDGVFDEDDRCPNTPVGAKVDQYGCWTVGNVLFEFDKSVIRPEFHSLLKEVVRVFERNPGLRVEIQGHTCNIGTEAYNQNLSERRAKSVHEYMVNHGVNPAQLKTVGFGLSRPIASNATREGRVRNRRVEFRPIK